MFSLLTPTVLLVSYTLSIQSLHRFGTALAARTETVLYPQAIALTAAPKRISGEPASSAFDWNFTANHSSSDDFSTSVGSRLHVVLPKLHTGHG